MRELINPPVGQSFAGMAADADASGGTALPASGLDKGQGGFSSQLESYRLVPLSRAILQRTATLLISADAKLIIGRSFEHRTRRFRRLTEDKMGALVFVCPATGLEVFTGLEMDHDSFAALPSVLPDLSCPHCPNRTSYPKCPLGWPKASVELMGPPQARLPLPKIKVFAENLERNPVTSPLPGFLCRRNPYYLREF